MAKNKKRYIVIGAGKMGRAVAYDLLQNSQTEHVTLWDRSVDAVRSALDHLNDRRVLGHTADINAVSIETTVKGHDVAIGAASYDYNVRLSEACIAMGVHFCDLGGNNDVVAAQFALDDDARKAGVRILPDCGIAPGAVSVLAEHGLELFGALPDFVRIRVGGLPQEPTGALKYAQVFSVRGLINECKEPTEIIRNGERVTVKSMTGLESDDYGDLGALESVYTSGGSSTFTRTYEGLINEVDYKTLRYPGHWAIMCAMESLGFWDERPVFSADGNSGAVPRDLTEALLERNLPKDQPDLLVLRVTVGMKNGHAIQMDMVDRADPRTGHSAMQRTTAYSASIVAQMLANDEIWKYGTLKHENDVPTVSFLEQWKQRGLDVKIRQIVQP